MIKATAKPNAPIILAQSAVAVSKTGDTNEATLASITIPAGAMGANGSLRLTTVWSMTNNANVKNVITKWGGTNIATLACASMTTYREQRQIHNRNALNSQVCFISSFGGWSNSGVAIGTAAKDTSQDQVLAIATQLAVGTDTATLEAYTLELIQG